GAVSRNVMRAAVARAPTIEGRRERKKRELRALIYQKARQLFLTQGFEATTVEQVAAAADVAPATFFNHFQSKTALLGEMTTEVREGQRKGEVRNDLDAAFLTEMVLGALNATVINWMNDPNYPLEQRLRQAAAFIGEAIRPTTTRPRRAPR